MKKALITGITGQDGSYLAEFLLNKGYEVHGLIRRASTFNTGRIDHIYKDPHLPGVKLFLHYGDLSVSGVPSNLIYTIKPDEIYNLAAQSHVRVSFDMPEYTGDCTGLGTTRLLEALKKSGIRSKFYQASSSEMFGGSHPPQNETTLFYPRSPYAVAKVYSYWMTVNYREGYDLFACNGILFNHESPRRGETFVTRKITKGVASIIAGEQKILYMGNLEAKRDWGFAPEYVECQWLILQQEEPDDYVIGTGESRSIKDFINHAFDYVGVDIEWKGADLEEKAVVRSIRSGLDSPLKVGDIVIEIDPRYFRPTEVDFLQADISKAKKQLNWVPKIAFPELVKIMVDADMEALGQECPGEGEKILEEKGITWTKSTVTKR